MLTIEDQYIHKSCSKSKSRKRILFKNKDLGLKASPVKRSKTPFDTTMVVDGHLMPIRVNKRNRKLSTYRTQLNRAMKKSTKQSMMKSVVNYLDRKHKALWSKRETDWFKYERR